MGEVDPSFIQELEHRPKIATTVGDDGIPVIDLSDNCRTKDVIADIGNACRDWGFFQVINHGVPLEKLQRVQEASKKFFSQTLEAKNKVRRDEASVLGYYETEHTKNVRDWKEVYDIVVQNPTTMYAYPDPDPDDRELTLWTNKWPDYPIELREACEEYVAEAEKLSFRLMEMIALSLGLAPDKFHGLFKENQTSFMRLNHYPPCPAPHLALGVGRHKDAGALTVLAQDDVGGLEVKRKRDSEWIRVKPDPNAFIINVCDIIQVWSNDKYESVEHRVMVNSEKERFSVPFFFNPGHDVVVEPLEELVNEESPPKYRGYSWGKFLATRKRSNFMKLNVENIQIYHFRLP